MKRDVTPTIYEFHSVGDQNFTRKPIPWKVKKDNGVSTKEDLIHEVKKDHEGPKSQKEGKKIKK